MWVKSLKLMEIASELEFGNNAAIAELQKESEPAPIVSEPFAISF